MKTRAQDGTAMYIKMNQRILCIFLVTFVQYIHALSHKYTTVTPSNVKYSDYGNVHEGASTIECLSFCDRKDNCFSVNFNRVSGRCELTKHWPSIMQPDEATDSSWRVYSREHKVTNLKAWQKSTFMENGFSFVADYAIDGNRQNTGDPLKCSVTKHWYSYWAMELAYTADVHHVVITFNENSVENSRNMDLTLLISMSREESDSNIGTTCAHYAGPPTDSAVPVMLTCGHPVTGKFLKIIHGLQRYLWLCEVEVYSI